MYFEERIWYVCTVFFYYVAYKVALVNQRKILIQINVYY